MQNRLDFGENWSVDFPGRFLDRPAPAVVLSEEKEGGRGDAAHRGVYDEPEQLEKVAGLLRDYGQRRSVPPWQVFPFPSGYALLDGAEEQGGFDLYLLDVLMPGLDGIQTGAKLRAQGDPGEIVYLTNSRDHAVESYGVRAFYYLVKPVEAEALFCNHCGAQL